MSNSVENPIILLENVTKSYSTNNQQLQIILNSADFSVNSGEFLAVVAPSGRGKSTLLHLIAGLDEVDTGKIIVDNHELVGMNETRLALFRRFSIGIVFQNFNLFPGLTVMENIMLPMQLQRMKRKEMKERVNRLLKMVGLGDKANQFPSQLSGGEQQRIAVIRSLANDPAIILADEPTGNLDEANALQIFKLFQELNKEAKRTILIVTHDYWNAKKYASRIVTIKEGKLEEWREPE